MDLRQSLASAFATRYPLEAAAALESRPPEEVARVLEGLAPDTAAAVLERISPSNSARSIERIEAGTAAAILAELAIDDAVSLLRRLPPETRDAIIHATPEERAGAIRTVIGFPAGTAGALMDPRVVVLPVDMEADEALNVVRRDAEHVHFQLYVVDRERQLVGVLNLQDLFLARPKDRLGAMMRQAHHRLFPTSDRYAVARHPGWRESPSLPVVDPDGRILGSVHYRVARAIEDELYKMDVGPGDTAARALGDLFWAGMGGVIDALTAAVAPPRRRRPPIPAAPPAAHGPGEPPGDGQTREYEGEE